VTQKQLQGELVERRRSEDGRREADRHKDVFLATLAHELRNPLAPITNAVEILKLADTEAERPTALAMIERQLGHLARLIDDLLDASRINRGKLQLRRQPVALTEIVEQALEASRPHLHGAGQALTLALPPQPVRLVDPLPGHDQQGLGIGLSLARELVSMHGGHIEARSEGLARGSEFIVRLPILVDTEADAGTPAAAPEPEPGQKAGSPRPRRILVVDDNVDAARSLALFLRINDHEVEMAHDGLEAVAAAEHFRPEVIFLDIGMPRLDGYGACRRIRERPWGKTMVIVALTGWGQEEDQRKTREAGFDAHLVKPVDGAMLLATLTGLESPRP